MNFKIVAGIFSNLQRSVYNNSFKLFNKQGYSEPSIRLFYILKLFLNPITNYNILNRKVLILVLAFYAKNEESQKNSHNYYSL